MHNHGVRQLSDAYKLDQRHTLQYELEQAGYRTAIAGKFLNRWRLCNDDPPYFDRFAIMNAGYHDTEFRVDHDTGGTRCDGRTLAASYSTTFVQERAVEFLTEFDGAADDQPWFLYVTPFAPHQDVGDVPPAPERRARQCQGAAWAHQEVIGTPTSRLATEATFAVPAIAVSRR